MDNNNPHNIEAEKAVLGAILVDPNCIESVRDSLSLDIHDWFYEHRHNMMWGAVSEIHSQGKPIDQLILLNKLGADWIPFFSELVVSVPTSANVKHYADMVRETYDRRKVIYSASHAVTKARDKSSPIHEAVAPLKTVVDSHKPLPTDKELEEIVDPGPIPEELLHVPGFVNDIMEYTMSQAHYPNRYMAFCGALSLMGLLTGRKVTDEGGTRTNLYVLALAHSASGKDKPRKVNVDIMEQLARQSSNDSVRSCVADKFSSPEGIEDSLEKQPSILWQCDEINGMINAVGNTKDTNRSGIMSLLLQLYTSSSSSVGLRRRANDESVKSVINPNFNLLGTAVPRHFYESLSEQMMDNGFFARMLIVEDGANRVPNWNLKTKPIPQHLISVAMYWYMLNIGAGENLANTQPVLKTINYTVDAQDLINRQRMTIDKRWNACNAAGDCVGTSIWGRAYELTCKLALLYACSKGVVSLPDGTLIDTGEVNFKVDFECVEWASQVVYNQTLRMLYKVNEKSYGSDHEKLLKKLKGMLVACESGSMKRSLAMRRMGVSSKDLDSILETMVESDIVEVSTLGGRGRPATVIKLK